MIFVSGFEKIINSTNFFGFYYESFDNGFDPSNTGDSTISFNKCVPLENIYFGIPDVYDSIPVDIPLGNIK